MLKYFRLYNKYILAVGMSLLMLAFLIQPVMSIFMPDPQARVEGHAGGQPIRVRDLVRAEAELRVLESMPMVDMLLRSMIGTENRPLHWRLLVLEAEQLGLSASRTEVDAVLASVGLDDATQAKWSQQTGQSQAFLRQSVKHWLMVEQYRELLLGRAYSPDAGGATGLNASTPGLYRLSLAQQAYQAAMSGNQFLYQMVASIMDGSVRVSDAAIQAFLQERAATVEGQLVKVPATYYLDRVPEPTEEQLQRHFATYRGYLPDASEPYGFGYRVPDRIKIEYITVPADKVREKLVVPETDYLAFYEQNKQQITEYWRQSQGPDAAPDAEPTYTDVRQAVVNLVNQRKAEELTARIIKAAQGRLDDGQRGLKDDGRYKLIPENYQPTDMRALAEELTEKFGVPIGYENRKGEWVEADGLLGLPGLGRSEMVGGAGGIAFHDYALSAKQFEPATDNPLAAMRLQVGLQGKPMRDRTGSTFIFRLTAAEPAHNLESLDEVRDLVQYHVKLVAAYELMASPAEQDKWLTVAKNNNLQAIADQTGAAVTSFGPMPQLQFTPNGRTLTSNLPGVGPNEAFITAIFDKALALTQGGVPIADQPVSQRLVAQPIADKLALAVARIDSYDPITQSMFELFASRPDIRTSLTQSLTDPSAEDPLSLAAVKRRTAYKGESETDEAPAATSASAE